jgi:hypothetical protein
LQQALRTSPGPASPVVMSLGVIASFTLAYPANVWLVARSLKRGAEPRFLGPCLSMN